MELLTYKTKNVILPLTKETLSQLKLKHQDNRDASDNILLNRPINGIHPIVFDVIHQEIVFRAGSNTKADLGQSGLEADDWRRMLTANLFGGASLDLCKLIADFIKKLCSKKINFKNQALQASMACRLIPLNKIQV